MPDAYRATTWPDEVAALRSLLSTCGLDETIKWAKPCFVHDGRNIAIVQEFSDHVAVMFFKGALLDDPGGVLVAQGPNSRSAMRVSCTSVADVERLAPAIRGLVDSAIAVEDAGLSVAPDELVLVEEFAERLASDETLRAAFESLTPGRRREYNLHIGSAKKAETRRSRIEKVAPRILAGRGLRDR